MARTAIDGELRLRGEFWQSPELGFEGRETANLLLMRALFGVRFEIFRTTRLYLQLGAAENLSFDPVLRPFDVDRAYFQQAYVQFEPFQSGDLKRTSLVIGRQQLPLGSSRLVGVREGPNVRLSFDAIRFRVGLPRLTIDALGGFEVKVNPGIFDDAADPSRALWGAYSHLTGVPLLPKGLELDLYYLGIRRLASYRSVTGEEVRHSFGARLFGTHSLGERTSIDVNWEAVLQTGAFASTEILAWTLASEQGVTFELEPAQVRLGLRANITSGDKEPGDHRLETFNPLYPKLPYFSELSIVAPMNHRDIHPLLALRVAGSVSLEASYAWFFKEQRKDDVYAPSGLPAGGSQETGGLAVGEQLNLECGLDVTPSTTLSLYYSYFLAGPALLELGAVDSELVLFWTRYRF